MMNSVLSTWFILVALGPLVGCAENNELIKEMITSVTQDVFQEIEDAPLENCCCNLHISFSLKTHRHGLHVVKDNHGTPDFEILLNIDGQAISLRGSLQKENKELRG